MAKFEGHNKLHPEDRELILQDFYSSFFLIKTEDELISYLNDLLSEPELEMLARRVQIARMLKENFTYEQIRSTLCVSEGTVASTAQALKRGEGGLDIIASKLAGVEAPEEEEVYVEEPEDDDVATPIKTRTATGRRSAPTLGRLRETGRTTGPAINVKNKPATLRKAAPVRRVGWGR